MSEGKNVSVSFSVKKYGEDLARSMAIRARLRGLKGVEGAFWVSKRGLVNAPQKKQKVGVTAKQVRRVA